MDFGLVTGLWRHRQLILTFARREIDARYRGALLGRAWVLVNHLSLIAIYTFVFSVVLKTRLNTGQGTVGIDFALWLYCGLLPWLALNEAMSSATREVVSKANFVKKVVFPLEVLPISTVMVSLFNMGIGLLMLLVGSLVIGTGLHWTDLMLIPFVIPFFLFMTGLTLFLSSVGVYFRDLGQLIGLISMVWLYATPIMYTSKMIPHGLITWFQLNPLTSIVAYFRDALFWGKFPSISFLGMFTLSSVVVYCIGLVTFQRVKRGFADVL